MDDLLIDFDETEEYEWKTFGESLSSLSGRLSSRFLREAVSEVTEKVPFLDYNSFVSFVAAHNLDIIPNEDLVRLERLGFGATRTVFRGTCPSRWGDQQVAIKRLNLEIPRTKSDLPANADELYQQLAEASLELRVLSNLMLRFHPNIVDLMAVSWEEVHGEICDDSQGTTSFSSISIRPLLIVELADQQHATLSDFMAFTKLKKDTVSMDLKVSFLSGVADALSAVHACGVVHGDIKPQNILIFTHHDGSLIAKLSDFGGCHNPEDGNQPNLQAEYIIDGLAGTEYWNAPEAISREHPDFGLVTRDHYSLGLVAFYLLFEELPFGNDTDSRASNRERIARLKDDLREMRQLVLKRFHTRWRLGGSERGVKELASVQPFYDRQEKFQELYKAAELFELFRRDDSWIIVRSDDFRHYSILFITCQFLQRDAGKRQKDKLMHDMKAFLNDKDIATSLRDIYLIQAWEEFWSVYESDPLNAWHIGAMFQEGQITTSRVLPSQRQPESRVKIAWKYIPSNTYIADEYSTSAEMLHLDQLPHSLRAVLVQEARHLLAQVPESHKIVYLLFLAYCEFQGYAKQTEGRNSFLLQAARLGSSVAKNTILALSEAELLDVEIEQEECLQWFYDVLLVKNPVKEQVRSQISQLIPQMPLHFKVLRKVFESEALRRRVERKQEISTIDEAEETRLAFDYAKNGDVSRLESLLVSGPKGVMETKVDGYNLLHVAVEYGQIAVIHMLVQKVGMHVGTLTDNGDPPSVIALRAHNLDTLHALLALGADHEAVLGAHTLRCMANYGGLKALRSMVYYASLWTKKMDGRTEFPFKSFLDGSFSTYEERVPDDEAEFPPIFASILGSNLPALGYLLEMGCSTGLVQQFSSGVLAPIHVAANFRPLYLALLLHHGADPNQRTADKNQWTALQIACVACSVPTYLFPRAMVVDIFARDGRLLGLQPADYTDANIFAVRLLIGYGSSVNAQDWAGRTALAHCMSHDRSLPVAKLLVDHYQADLGIKDFRGLSCLHHAVLGQSSAKLVEFCIEKGHDLDVADIYGVTPLMMAANFGNLDAIPVLVKAGASLVARQHTGRNALNLAIHAGTDEAAELLFQASKDQECFDEITTSQDYYGYSVLHQLFFFEQPYFDKHIAHFSTELIQESLSTPDPMGFSLLHHAVLARNPATVCFLLQHGADANAKGWRELRPLHIAYGKNQKSIISLLESSGADVGLQDRDGWTPLNYAASLRADPSFWEAMEQEFYDERTKHSQGVFIADFDRIEEENREKARAMEDLKSGFEGMACQP